MVGYMRKEVYLCDNCERTIADGKCSACGNDVCSKCANRIGISLSYGGYGKIFNVKIKAVIVIRIIFFILMLLLND